LEDGIVYAVVETGGKQYKVTKGQEIDVEKLNVEPGQTIELDKVLLVSNDDQVAVGQPTVPGARVVAKVVGDEKGPKLTIFRYKSKVRYRRKTGHRQTYTRLAIEDIIPGQA
jgi:large subunit ribosomal protein L21